MARHPSAPKVVKARITTYGIKLPNVGPKINKPNVKIEYYGPKRCKR